MHQNIYNFILKISYMFRQSRYRPRQALRVPVGWGSQIFRQSAVEGGKVVSPTHQQPSSGRCRVRDASQTAGEPQRTFTLNHINATIVYQYYSPWRWPSRAETYRRFLRIKLYIFFGALVGVITSYYLQYFVFRHLQLTSWSSKSSFFAPTQDNP
jgi:hypothetical protein